MNQTTRMSKSTKSFNDALAAMNKGDLKRAEELFARVIDSDRNNVSALNLLVIVLMSMGRFAEAEPFIARATSLNQKSDVSFYNYGLISKRLNKPRQALENFSKALDLNSNVPETWNNRGTVFNDLERYDLAIADFDKAIFLNCAYGEAYANKGKSLARLKRYDEAFSAYGQALSIKPDIAEAWLGCGNVLADTRRYDEAFAAYGKALSIKPDSAEAWLGRGNVFAELRRYDEAFAAYEKALSIKPDLESVEGGRLNAKVHLCNWHNLETEIGNLVTSIRAGKANSTPFMLLSLIDSSEDHLRCAKAWVAAKHPQAREAIWRGLIYAHNKIRIGYVSADFHNHATASLVTEVFECHDKLKFTTTAFTIGQDDNSAMRQRLVNAFDAFVDCRSLSDADVARSIADSEIDILVDLKGFTQNARTDIFGYRPAPIQVNYLGYPGTMGAPYIDYIIGDKTLFTLADATVYSEKLVQLPGSYQPNDRKREISTKAFTRRQEAALPEGSFVFCCFNNNYKLLPDMFERWMRIMQSVGGSVLWLLAENQTTIANLRREAVARGIHPDRLVFAPRMELPGHLARHRLADLFLDTLPYNAHTTASDALWTGLPVLTQIGSSFAGRVAASLLKAVDLPELITYSSDEYEALAIGLANNKERLQSIREKLSRNRLTTSLFNSPMYTRHLEAAFEAMYQRYQTGSPPDHIEIKSH
jgi:predicted O-linked N-acetylglucosamine transferase (SPINDLY family)